MNISEPEMNGGGAYSHTQWSRDVSGNGDFVNFLNTTFFTRTSNLSNTPTFFWRATVNNTDGFSPCYAFPLNQTISDNEQSNWHLCETTNDNGWLDNDGTVTVGTEQYDTVNGFTGFDFDQATTVRISGPESDYDWISRFAAATFTMWIYPHDDFTVDQALIAKAQSTGLTGWTISYVPSGDHFEFTAGQSGNDICTQRSNNIVLHNQWSFIAVVKPAGSLCDNIIMYVNATDETVGLSGDMDTFTNNLNVTIGSNDAGGKDFDGLIKDLRIFNTTLDAHQIDQIFNEYIDLGVEPKEVDDLASPSQTVGSIDIDWTQPFKYRGTISGYQINTTTPFGAPETILVNDTGTDATSYEVSGLLFGTDYSLRVAPWTQYGTNPDGNILNITTLGTTPTVGSLSLNQTNPDIVDVRFVRTNVDDTTTQLDVIYPSTSNMTCTLDYEFARSSQNYSNLDTKVFDSSHLNSTFVFTNHTNDIVQVYCVDENDSTIDGRYELQWSQFPLLDQIDNFRNGTYGTQGQIGVLDFVTLGAIIIGMIGLNRVNESVGAVFGTALLGAMAYFGIIELPTVIFGFLAVAVLFIFTTTKKD